MPDGLLQLHHRYGHDHQPPRAMPDLSRLSNVRPWWLWTHAILVAVPVVSVLPDDEPILVHLYEHAGHLLKWRECFSRLMVARESLSATRRMTLTVLVSSIQTQAMWQR